MLDGAVAALMMVVVHVGTSLAALRVHMRRWLLLW